MQNTSAQLVWCLGIHKNSRDGEVDDTKHYCVSAILSKEKKNCQTCNINELDVETL